MADSPRDILTRRIMKDRYGTEDDTPMEEDIRRASDIIGEPTGVLSQIARKISLETGSLPEGDIGRVMLLTMESMVASNPNASLEEFLSQPPGPDYDDRQDFVEREPLITEETIENLLRVENRVKNDNFFNKLVNPEPQIKIFEGQRTDAQRGDVDLDRLRRIALAKENLLRRQAQAAEELPRQVEEDFNLLNRE